MTRTLTAFAGDERIGAGDENELRAMFIGLGSEARNILLFDDETGRQVDIDMRGAVTQPVRGRGRPKLGVQAREVTLLPRHWDWLGAQPGGVSAVLRRLVEAARKDMQHAPSPRAAKDATYHFLMVMAGDRPGYEAAIRALYAGDKATFEAKIGAWPPAIRAHAGTLSLRAFEQS